MLISYYYYIIFIVQQYIRIYVVIIFLLEIRDIPNRIQFCYLNIRIGNIVGNDLKIEEHAQLFKTIFNYYLIKIVEYNLNKRVNELNLFII